MINNHEKLEQLRAILARYPSLHQSNFSFNKLCMNRFLTEGLFIILLQYIGTVLILLFAPLLWIASGTACGFIFLRGKRITFGVWVGTFIAFYSILRNFPVATLCASCLTLQPIGILKINYWFNNETLIFYHLSKFFYFIVSVAATTAVTTFVLVHLIPQIFSFMICWLANLAGALTFSIALVSLDMYFSQLPLLKDEFNFKVWLFFIANIILFVLLLVLNPSPFLSLSLSMLILFLTFEISKKNGWCAAILVIFIQSLLLGLINCFAQFSYSLANYFIIQLLLIIELILGLARAIIVYNYTES